jgi:hypothetical protein
MADKKYFDKLKAANLSLSLNLKKPSDLQKITTQTFKGYIVLDAYGDELKEEYKHKLEERILHMGRYNLRKKDMADIYNKELQPIYRTFEEAYGFAEFSYGNNSSGATHTVHEVEIKIKPEILDINGGRDED